jgi:hypothetical protein
MVKLLRSLLLFTVCSYITDCYYIVLVLGRTFMDVRVASRRTPLFSPPTFLPYVGVALLVSRFYTALCFGALVGRAGNSVSASIF